MDIGQAVAALTRGEKVARAGWNGKGMWLCYMPGSEGDGWAHRVPGITPRPLLPFVAMNTAQQDLVPWLCSQTDLLATDWEIVS